MKNNEGKKAENFSKRLKEITSGPDKDGNVYSLKELAEKLGVSTQAISKWRSGASSPRSDKLIKLAEIYDLSFDSVLGRTDLSSEEAFEAYKIYQALKDNETEDIKRLLPAFHSLIQDESFGELLTIIRNLIRRSESEVQAERTLLISFCKIIKLDIPREILFGLGAQAFEGNDRRAFDVLFSMTVSERFYLVKEYLEEKGYGITERGARPITRGLDYVLDADNPYDFIAFVLSYDFDRIDYKRMQQHYRNRQRQYNTKAMYFEAGSVVRETVERIYNTARKNDSTEDKE